MSTLACIRWLYFYRTVKLYRMIQIGLPGSINRLLKTNKVLLLMLTFLFSLDIAGSLPAQAPDPVLSIRDLKEGYLIIRMTASKPKTDTLQAMISRSTDEDNTA